MKQERLVVNIFYYSAPLDLGVDAKKYWKQQKFFAILRKIPGFNVVLCRMKKHKKKDGRFEFEVKRDDVHLATDLISGAYEGQYDTALIVSGDEDFVSSIKKIQKLGKKVENIYFSSTSSNYLKKVCDISRCFDDKISKAIRKIK